MAPAHDSEDFEAALKADEGVIESIFDQAIRAAWNDYGELYSPQVRLLHSKRTRATIVYDHARHHLAALLDPLDRARVVICRGLTVVVLDDRFVIKIPKRLSRRKLSRTFPTQQTLNFLHQAQQEAFSYFVPRTNVIVGYVLDELELSISAIYATCPNGPRHNHWVQPIEADAGESAAPPQLPAADLPDSPIQPDDEEGEQDTGSEE